MPEFQSLSLENDHSEDVIGTLPQIQVDYNPEEGKSFDYEGLHKLKPQEEPIEIPHYFFATGAKKTDVLTAEWIRAKAGFFISEKLKHLLSSFSLGWHSFYTVPISLVHPEQRALDKEYGVETEEKSEMYYFLHLAKEKPESMDYEKSAFVSRTKQDLVLEINSPEDFVAEIRKMNFPKWKKAFLKKRLDLFRLPSQTDVFASPELVNAMKENGITGFDVLPARLELTVQYD